MNESEEVCWNTAGNASQISDLTIIATTLKEIFIPRYPEDTGDNNGVILG